MARFTVRFAPSGHSATAAPNTTILEAAAAAGLTLHSPCGGRGRCGKCAVRAGPAGLDELKPAEEKVFTQEEIAAGWRLACQARVVDDVEVTVPPSSLVVEHRIAIEGVGREILLEPNIRKIALRLPPPTADDPRADLSRLLEALGGEVRAPAGLDTLQALPGALRASDYQVTAIVAGHSLIGIEGGDTSSAAYGVAVDIGTTTMVAYLCHLLTGEVVQVASALNPQAQYGGDVISRLQMAVSEEGGSARLAEAVRESVNHLIQEAAQGAGVAPGTIYELAVVGNTCMSHLFLGIPPVGLAGLPFAPAFRRGQTLRAADLGMGIHPEGPVYVVPNIGGYVGADTVGVILASQLDERSGVRVAVDIGTNGEIVLARDGDLYACSAAAGPAFEGAKISRGMRAAAGAIDRVAINDDVSYHVIGETAPTGLCGSGLVDAAAELVRVGAVEESGRLRGPEELASLPEKVRRRLVRNEAGLEFVLADARNSGSGRSVAITARDVRELQLAKGALYAGISLLLDRLSLGASDIEEILLAGAFGNYISRESAIAIGLVPALAPELIVSIGNAAGLGARLVLSSVSLRRRAEEIARRVRHIELSEQEGFYDRFAEAMALRPMAQGA